MTDIDDDVRSLLTAAAEMITPDSVPPLRLPQAHAGLRRRASARRLPTSLAPIAAAAAVALIATAALVISNTVASRQSPGSRGDAAVPPYYIALNRTDHHYAAAIYATRTGALIRWVVVPGPNQPITGVSAAADDRTFAIAAAVGKPGKTGQPTTRFYLVRFNPATRDVRIKLIPRLQVPQGTPFRSMSLSPSGTKLAVNINPGASKSGITDVLKIMDLTTGIIRTWTSSTGEIYVNDSPSDMSWANDETTLGFSWSGFTWHPERTLPTSGFWLLDLAKPAGNLLADSHRVLVYDTRDFDYTVQGHYLALFPMLAADGQTIVTALSSKPSDTRGTFWFATYDAANGRLERRFDRLSLRKAPLGPNEYLLWTSPHADAFIVDPPPGHNGRIGIVRRSGRLTLLPTRQGQTLLPGPAW